MIKNDRQYHITKNQYTKLKLILDDLRKQKDIPDPIIYKAQIDSLENQAEDLEKEIKEYESLLEGKLPNLMVINSLETLPLDLIRIRIARRMTQRDLAEILGVKEQQIQRWEAEDYQTISFKRMREIVCALKAEIPVDLEQSMENISPIQIIRKMENLGISKEFIFKRLFHPMVASLFEEQYYGTIPEIIGMQAAVQIGRVFDWTPQEIFNNDQLQLVTSQIPEVRFKLPRGRNELRVNAYTKYAHYIATLIEQVTRNIKQAVLPTNPYEIYKSIISKFGSIDLPNLVRFTWNLGIPVIALDDPGAFDGVCFQINKKKFIILKQNTTFEARWMFDLLHEFWHATIQGASTVHISLEIWKNPNPEDVKANQFASAALLGRIPSDLAKLCVQEASKTIIQSKIIKKIAEREGVRVDVLANYLAFRMQKDKKENIWSIAHKLQKRTKIDPRIIIKNIFLENADLSSLSTTNMEILGRALNYRINQNNT